MRKENDDPNLSSTKGDAEQRPPSVSKDHVGTNGMGVSPLKGASKMGSQKGNHGVSGNQMGKNLGY